MSGNEPFALNRIRTRQKKFPDASLPTETASDRSVRSNFHECLVKNQSPSLTRKSKKSNKEGRNIENVTLGDVRFQAWYSSWYPKEFLGKENNVIKNLFVCPRCFAYSRGEEKKEIWAWLKHCQNCKMKAIPGKKIYVHGEWIERIDDTPITNMETWSVWEVDGATETVFCQNLSLFAKLFLENKSVFFDVSGFKFFLLVYAAPRASSAETLESQIIGFFSKEKISWDNNNLACILIFPPWQRKGLGSLLIGISYAIARRKNIMGGPERPISDLGLKGYRGFWDIETISRETWISPDDCLSMIKEMDVLDQNYDISDSLSTSTKPSNETTKYEICYKRLGDKSQVSIDRRRLRDWVVREGLQLVSIVSEKGFRPEYCLNDGIS
ncbi:putative histone acetyltransferase sas2 [Erysiphe necator]|uniref:histone acetyltransferase n=1 Tax=Uncinula necator TaxID=52586 RepID=A0A0B1PH33_UNCNE|nr:putative histone acetyltransferase sas2 [Erysiphe necator]